MYRGDAIAALEAVPDATIDAIVTDPPYGIELLRRGTNKRAILGDGKAEARELWRRWIPAAYRVAKPDTLHVVFGTWKCSWMAELLAQHFAIKGCIVWDKRTIGLGHYLRPRWEMAYVIAKGRPPRRGVAPADIWEHRRVARPHHPCEKPVDLLRRAVRFVAEPGATIFDPFCGIGSTGVAALLERCRFLGFERSPKFARAAQARLDRTLVELSP